MLKLKFFKNCNGAAVGDLYFDGRRLIATTHPATIVAAAHLMDVSELMVETDKGLAAGTVQPGALGDVPLPVVQLVMNLNPDSWQFLDLATTKSEEAFLKALDIFSHENWNEPNQHAQEHLDTARYFLPADCIVKKSSQMVSKAQLKKKVTKRFDFVYFPDC